jgi:hypothetical protein
MSQTNYFIIDSSSSIEHNDVDFKYYSYQNRNNNQLHKGDLIFIVAPAVHRSGVMNFIFMVLVDSAML